jgi:iron complex outermembrane receptor protein
VRGKLSGGGNLPRISPTRLGVEGGLTQGRWSLQGAVTRVARQSRVAELESATAGYTRVDGELSYRVSVNNAANPMTGEWTVYLQGRNLTDKEIRVHTSYLKDVAPQPGRGFVFGVRATF